MWIEGVKREVIVENSRSTTGSSRSSSGTGSTYSEAGSPNSSPTLPPSTLSLIPLSTLQPVPENKEGEDEEEEPL